MASKSNYRVILTKKAEKQLAKLDRTIAQKIYSWIMNNLEGCEDPRIHGKALSGDRAGEWRYRVGDYRILAEIRDEVVIIEVFKIGHRREVYDN